MCGECMHEGTCLGVQRGLLLPLRRDGIDALKRRIERTHKHVAGAVVCGMMLEVMNLFRVREPTAASQDGQRCGIDILRLLGNQMAA